MNNGFDKTTEKYAKKTWYKRWWAILLFVLLALILTLAIVFAYTVYDYVKKIKSGEIIIDRGQGSASLYDDPIMKKTIEGLGNPWLGTSDAKLVIVEFADFNCSQCKNSYSKMRMIATKYPEDVKIIFRDFPVFENSTELALAGRCAHEQKLFWPMHDKLFQNQGTYETKEALADLAVQIGADADKFIDCMAENRYQINVEADYNDGLALNLEGTPTWFFNGYKIAGDIPYDTFVSIIEKFLE